MDWTKAALSGGLVNSALFVGGLMFLGVAWSDRFAALAGLATAALAFLGYNLFVLGAPSISRSVSVASWITGLVGAGLLVRDLF